MRGRIRKFALAKSKELEPHEFLLWISGRYCPDVAIPSAPMLCDETGAETTPLTCKACWANALAWAMDREKEET